MQKYNVIGIMSGLWAALPLLTGLCVYLLTNMHAGVMLFLLYGGFTWSIALLAFTLETSRCQMSRDQRPLVCGRRLALLSTGAMLLAYLFSPLRSDGGIEVLAGIVLTCFSYGIIAGGLYCRVFYPEKKTTTD